MYAIDSASLLSRLAYKPKNYCWALIFVPPFAAPRRPAAETTPSAASGPAPNCPAPQHRQEVRRAGSENVAPSTDLLSADSFRRNEFVQQVVTVDQGEKTVELGKQKRQKATTLREASTLHWSSMQYPGGTRP
jgi:hypothetical protein